MKKRNVVLASLLMLSGAVFAQKLSPSTEMLLLNHATGVGVKTEALSTDGESVNAFVKINSQTVLGDIERLGGVVRTNPGGNLVTVSLPIAKLREIAALDDVAFIQAAPKVFTRMDKAREDCNVAQCQDETSEMGSYTGKGVIVGLVDTGMEYTHIDYYDSDRTETRLSRVWDQNGTGSAPEGFNYGKEYTTAEDIKAKRYDTQGGYHAGHVLGIAAGADKESGYQGIATDAELVFVSMDDDASNVVDGVKYIFDYAESVGKPCVVNLSLGLHQGPHDGTSTFDKAFDELVGPGRIIVGAAGNEGADGIHVTKTLSGENDSMRVMMGGPAYYSYSGIDLYGEVGSDITVKYVILNTATGEIVAESEELSTADNTSKNLQLKHAYQSVYIQSAAGLSACGRPEVLTVTQPSISGNYKIGIIATSAEGTTLHAWQLMTYDTFTETTAEGWTSPDYEYSVGEIGGTGKSVISVGSYNTKITWTTLGGSVYNYDKSEYPLGGRSSFSSVGPTVDGRTKPEVSAPGYTIISAMSRYSGNTSSSNVARTNVNGQYHYYGAAQGTSMSSPFVTGVVALWLQANPNLTPDDVKNIIQQTARHDDFTGDEANNNYGYGKIDAFAGLQYILKNNETGIADQHATEGMFRVVSDATAHTAQIYFDDAEGGVTLNVYNTLGQQVHSQEVTTNGQSVSISGLTPGIYVFKLQRGNSVRTVKASL